MKTPLQRKGLHRKLVLYHSGILPPNSGEHQKQKKGLCRILGYLRPEFQIFVA